MDKNITIKVRWVPTTEMLADPISRWDWDPGDYSLDPQTFQYVLSQYKDRFTPKVDMFASPGNQKLGIFVCRWPHWQAAAVDALTCPLDRLGGGALYANPPWKLISRWLARLRENPQVTCLVVVPFWVGASWWPLLTKLKVPNSPVLKIKPFQGLFTNCRGRACPPPGGT